MDALAYEHLRLNKMTKFVFTVDNMSQLQEAVQDVFCIFREVLESQCVSYSDLKDRLDMVDACKWEAIRSQILFDDYIGYSSGKFNDTELISIVKILLDFIALVEVCSKSVIKKIEEKHGNTIELENKVKQMEERIKKTESFVELQKTHYNEKCAENSRLASKNAQLQENVDDKQKRISQLEKLNNVQMWEHEKQKLMKESAEKIAGLEKEIEEMKQGREGYKRRMSNIDSSYQKMLMKQQLMSERGMSKSSMVGDDDDDDANKKTQLSRTNFIQDKDIAYLEKQLYDLQSNTVGVIGGIKTDFMKLNHKIADVNDGLVDSEFELLSSRMKRVYQAVTDGEIEKVKQVLPPHYKYIENDDFKVKRIRRLSQTAVVPPQSVLNGILEQKKPIQKSMSKSSCVETLKKIDEAPVSNPEIVNPRTKKAHPINAIKYFGHMAQNFILDQFGKFNEFDKNGDGTLDLSEVVVVVKELGFQFNTHELQEAMEEVDRDNNHILDFYEYLLIVDNIYRRNGKAELFKVGLTELNKKNVSKSCVVQ